MVRKDTTWYIFGTVLDNDKNYAVADVTSVDSQGNIYLVDRGGDEYEMRIDRWKNYVRDGYIVPASSVDESSWEVASLLSIFENANIEDDERLRRAAQSLFDYAGRERQ